MLTPVTTLGDAAAGVATVGGLLPGGAGATAEVAATPNESRVTTR